MTGERERFLGQVAAELPLPPEIVDEVVAELDAHLADSVAELVAHGTRPELAEAGAIARLGPPALLANGLARAHRGRAQLLAAAGAGTWALVRTGALGTLLGSLLVALASVLTMSAGRAVAGWLGFEFNPSWTSGWNTVLTATGLNIGALLAGAAAVRAVSRRGWRTPAEVRPAVIALGGTAVGWLVLVAFQASLNWASVLALLLVPVSFGVGAGIEPLRPPTRRTTSATLVGGIVLVMALNVGVAATGGVASSYQWSETTVGYEMIAPWWQDPATGQAMDFPSASSGWSIEGIQTTSVEAADPAVVGRFRDFRLEAWRAESPRDGWRLIPGQSGPFATAPAFVDGLTVSGTIRFNQVPGIDWAVVVLTGIGPDGRRYLVNASGPERTDFYGSVWSWFAALGD